MPYPRRVRDLTGQTFGHLTVLEYVGNNKHRMAVWKCRCDCGKEMQTLRGTLVTGNTISCGCHKLDNVITHGYKGTPTYACWNSMKQRGLNPRNEEYPNYGGRGITVSEEWKKFENFLADMGEKPPKISIDRKAN